MNKDVKQNILAYLFILIIAVIGIYYGNQISSKYVNLRIWNFSDILILLTGIPFLFFQRQARIPDFLNNNISNKNRFLIPVLTGIIFGVLDIVVFKLILHPEPYNELPPFLQPFPYSVFLYISGALEIEVFSRLIPVTVLCFAGSRISSGKYFMQFFWVAAILTSVREPLEQVPGGSTWLVTYSLVSGFLMNLLQVVYFKKSGFLASFSVRAGHYLLWHILLGIYVEGFEL